MLASQIKRHTERREEELQTEETINKHYNNCHSGQDGLHLWDSWIQTIHIPHPSTPTQNTGERSVR